MMTFENNIYEFEEFPEAIQKSMCSGLTFLAHILIIIAYKVFSRTLPLQRVWILDFSCSVFYWKQQFRGLFILIDLGLWIYENKKILALRGIQELIQEATLLKNELSAQEPLSLSKLHPQPAEKLIYVTISQFDGVHHTEVWRF